MKGTFRSLINIYNNNNNLYHIVQIQQQLHTPVTGIQNGKKTFPTLITYLKANQGGGKIKTNFGNKIRQNGLQKTEITI